MAKKEVKTDLWVYDLLKEANIELTPQGCDIKEIDEALKTASKRKTGKEGYPEYCGVVKDFVLVIEDKDSIEKHVFRDEKKLISQDVKAVEYYAVNGALHYGLHIAQKTSYKKILAFGVSGSPKRHRITPIFINERGDYQELPDVETFISFSERNIDEYYIKELLKEASDIERKTEDIIKDAEKLHNDFRAYANFTNEQKPLVVSGIMLALREIKYNNFDINKLTGDKIKTDGEKIYEAIEANIRRANVSPEVKRDKLLRQFLFIKDRPKINDIDARLFNNDKRLDKTPLRYFTEFLYDKIYKSAEYNDTSVDYLALFYGEFMSYSGADGKERGIVLTPKHITELFCLLADLDKGDKVIDPCCGTASFLVSAMHFMQKQTNDDNEKEHIAKQQLFGIEEQEHMFAVATTNMILRGDGKSNLENQDFLAQNPAKLQLKGCNVGFMNPPYSLGKADKSMYEICFTEHLLDSLTEGGKCIVIFPQSSVTGKTVEEKNVKRNILKKHTLEGVITLNKNTFYGVGTNTCIAIFTAWKAHQKEHKCKFINFEDDGYVVSKHTGLVETSSAKDKRQHLLDVWFNRIEAVSSFCVETTIEPDDEWLHSFYYFNEEIPSETDFEQAMADYLTFEFSMITHGKGYLFDRKEENK
jgi:type I restriction-modification system DNA methylase subunit